VVRWQRCFDRELQVISSEVFELDPLSEPPLGAHVVTPRRWYTHHAIYVGRGRVVQYGGLSRGLRRGPVEEVAMEEFARGHPIWIRPECLSEPEQSEVVRRARLRLGEDRYDLLTNNCEHFCEWCIRGVSRSHQVERVMVGIRRVWGGLGDLCGAWLARRFESAGSVSTINTNG
jgi:Lecithin retinol acyltransferase